MSKGVTITLTEEQAKALYAAADHYIEFLAEYDEENEQGDVAKALAETLELLG